MQKSIRNQNLSKEVKIPSRKDRTELIKNRARNFYEYVVLKELEGLASKRLKEKLIITLVSIMWVFVGLYGQTMYCEIFGFPLAICTAVVGLWIL